MADQESKLRELIDRWIGGLNNIDGYSYDEFKSEVNKMIKKEEEYMESGVQFKAPSEVRIHRYALDNILKPLMGRLEYGKRN